VLFFVGLHQPSDAKHFARSFISINRLRGARGRRSAFAAGEWILDSGAFTEITRHGDFKTTVAEYAAQIRQWAGVGNLRAAVAQDWMCEPFALARTGLTVAQHQAKTIERFAELRSEAPGVYVLPVLQGFAPADYVAHVRQYGAQLAAGAWVGVGSVCKRNGNPRAIEAVLLAIRAERPDLRLHGFGLKTTALGLWPRASSLALCRFDGVVIRGAATRAPGERLARGAGLRRQIGDHALSVTAFSSAGGRVMAKQSFFGVAVVFPVVARTEGNQNAMQDEKRENDHPRLCASHHRKRHAELHAALDELVADWILQTGKRPSTGSILELLEWANKQRLAPDHPARRE
jgi:hypothetical protein